MDYETKDVIIEALEAQLKLTSDADVIKKVTQAIESVRWISDETYNGWSNYATWRVNLEIVEDMNYDDFDQIEDDIYDLSDVIMEKVEDILESEHDQSKEKDNFSYSYAMAFINNVNWLEIAKSVAEKYPNLIKSL